MSMKHFLRVLIDLFIFLVISSRFSVKCGVKNAKGIHIRTGEDKISEWTIVIEPVFCNDKDVGKSCNRMFFLIYLAHKSFLYFP